LRRAGRHLELRVRDFGPGIPADERRKIFEPFAKTEAHAAGTQPGVGLGLALCRRLAHQMSGDLRLEPANPGATFVLTLPAA
jgi:signal transduction histidine kinase